MPIGNHFGCQNGIISVAIKNDPIMAPIYDTMYDDLMEFCGYECYISFKDIVLVFSNILANLIDFYQPRLQ